MSVVKTFLFRIGQYLISIIRSLRKLLCCRRKKEVEYVLPMTIGDITENELTQDSIYENSEFKTQWDAWPGIDKSNSLNFQVQRTNSETDSQAAEDESQEDFFKDMIPQIRKQKKVFVRNSANDNDQGQNPSNRLAMDPSRIVTSSELGVIDDNPCNWENNEDSEQFWDPDALIREKKRAEQEKRRAEHQRRKQEKEIRKVMKPESLSSRMLSISESKDKDKYS